MKKQQIHNLFTQRYNQAKWKQFLGETFANSQLLSTPKNLPDVDYHVATNAQTLGYILLNEDGIERQIAVYEVTLADGIILERNRVGLRNLLRKYWKNIDAAFIVYHHPESVNWRFTYVSELTGYGADGEFIEIKTEPKRYTYILGEGESTRTAVERFERIINKGDRVSLDDVKEAFSVEKLSKTFFDEYKKHYDIFCKYMVSQPGIYYTTFNGDEKAIRDFSKKLLGRIVFLYFIQKKGWLGVPENESWGTGDHHFLTNQFQNFTYKELFYQDFLSVLFFDTLNTKRANDLFIKNPSYRIPYLNGGLFEEDKPEHRSLIFDNHLFANLFNFFDQYNFTIYEDDPLDHTIAVDPEMLGHIFENLLEDNKDKGAYYTPKEIVHYMCQESLIEYLTTWFENHGYQVITDATLAKSASKQINRTLIEKLLKKKLDGDDQKLIKNYAAEFNQALDNVKICDPAIGSGAFPMGLLHEIFTAKQTLHTFEFGNTTNFNASDVKLNIIQNSIYGVDIEPGAVDIARLRFWLSLIVDEPEPKALPNLDYKIVMGNSLVSKFGDDIIDIDWEIKDVTQGSILVDVYQPQAILRKISDKQKEFFSPDSDKKKLATDIRDLKIDLLISQLQLMIKTKGMEDKPTGKGKTLTKQTEIYLQTVGWKQNIKELKQLKNNPDKSLNFFDWKLDFPEVMNQQLVENVGFDIVIGNPPYVFSRNNLGEHEKDILNKIYRLTQFKINLYILFIEKGYLLMNKTSGVFFYITPNNWLTLETNSDLRKFILSKTKNIKILQNYANVFEGASVDTVIVGFKNKGVESVDYLEWIDKKPFIISSKSTNEYLSKNKFIISNETENQNEFLNKLARFGLQLQTICDVKNGVQAYTVGEGSPTCTEEMKNNRVYHNSTRKDNTWVKYLDGVDVCRYYLGWSGQYIKYGKNLSRPRRESLFIGDRILVRQIPSQLPYCINACFTNEHTINDNNSMIIKLIDVSFSIKYILGLLNSKLLSKWFAIYFGKLSRKIFPQFKINELRVFPIVKASNQCQTKIEYLVNQIITLKSQGKDTTALEQQIDNMVYKLYELTYEEVKIIDPENTLTEKEYADIKI